MVQVKCNLRFVYHLPLYQLPHTCKLPHSMCEHSIAQNVPIFSRFFFQTNRLAWKFKWKKTPHDAANVKQPSERRQQQQRPHTCTLHTAYTTKLHRKAHTHSFNSIHMPLGFMYVCSEKYAWKRCGVHMVKREHAIRSAWFQCASPCAKGLHDTKSNRTRHRCIPISWHRWRMYGNSLAEWNRVFTPSDRCAVLYEFI